MNIRSTRDSYFKNKTIEAFLNKSEGVVFDYNGLIVDDEPLQLQAFNQIFKKYGGISIDKETFISECVGKRPSEVFSYVFSKNGIRVNDISLCVEQWRKSREEIQVDPNSIIREGVRDLILYLTEIGKELCLVSSSSRSLITDSLSQLNLIQYFDALVTSNDVQHGKPAPDPYLRASFLLNIKPCKLLAFEDTSNGVQSAREAGIKCIAVPNRFTEKQNFSRASLILSSLSVYAKILVK